MSDVKTQFETIDALVKASSIEAAQEQLKKLRAKEKLSREAALEFSNLCRRANIPELGLLALRPYIFTTGRKNEGKASETEMNEYATNLIRIGACREAKNLLSGVSSKSATEVIHTLAYVNVKQWNYSAAIPLFLEYIGRDDLSSYLRQVAYLNLAMCLTFEEKLNAAAEMVDGVLRSKISEGNALLRANAFRLMGLIEFQKGALGESLKHFHSSKENLSSPNGLDAFHVDKWIGIVSYQLNDGAKSTENDLLNLRAKAVQLENWESVRDIDYQMASFQQNEEKLVHVYYGTPHESYRKRILKKFPSLSLPDSYLWNINQLTGKNPFVFDIEENGLKSGQAIQKLFAFIASDFYRPFFLVDVFDQVCMGGHYSYGHSEQVVHQLISRARRHLKAKKIPLDVQSSNNRVQLLAKNCVFRIHSENRTRGQEFYRFKALREKLGDSFTTSEVANLLSLSKRTIVGLLAKGIEQGLITRQREGSHTKYYFVEKLEEKKAA